MEDGDCDDNYDHDLVHNCVMAAHLRQSPGHDHDHDHHDEDDNHDMVFLIIMSTMLIVGVNDVKL